MFLVTIIINHIVIKEEFPVTVIIDHVVIKEEIVKYISCYSYN